MFAKFAIFILLGVAALGHAQAFIIGKSKLPDVGICLDTTNDWVTGISLDLSPWPFHVAAGEVLSINGQIEVLQAIEVGSSIRLKLVLHTVLGDLTIPCIPLGDLEIGSCTYPAQKLLDDLSQLDGACDLIMPEGQDCTLWHNEVTSTIKLTEIIQKPLCWIGAGSNFQIAKRDAWNRQIS